MVVLNEKVMYYKMNNVLRCYDNVLGSVMGGDILESAESCFDDIT